MFRGVKLDNDQMCREAAKVGAWGIDLVGPDFFPSLKKYGLIPTMLPGGSGIKAGINDPKHHAEIEPKMRQALKDAGAVKAPNVIVLAGDRASLFVRGTVNLLALPFDTGFGSFLTVGSPSGDTVGGGVALAAGFDLNRDGVPELGFYHAADQSLYAVQATSTGAFESTLRAELRLLLSAVGSALIAPGPTDASNGDYLVLLSPQGPRVCSSGIVAGCIAATGTSTSAFGAALGPVGNVTQGAFAVVMAGATSALATLTSSPVGTLTITRYSGVDGSAITWMAP